jgi:hypothetical protein
MQSACHGLIYSTPRLHGVVSVTVDSPEKQRGGDIGYCRGAVDQAWSPAEVAAAVVFELTLSGCDLSTATTPCKRGALQRNVGRLTVGSANDRSRRDSRQQQNAEPHLRQFAVDPHGKAGSRCDIISVRC